MNGGHLGKSAQTEIEVGGIDASFLGAAPHFLPLMIFPLLVAAAHQGGWWIAGPFVFLFANSLDPVFGIEERNMDPQQTPDGKLFWFKLSVWIWALLWPATLVFMLWNIFVAGDLDTWEQVVLVVLLAMVAPSVFMVSHEFIHRRAAWERRVAEILLASVSWPLYALEHVYVHHTHVGTPRDPESAPRGTSFWRFFANGLPRSLAGCWEYERNRLARSQRPPWHIANAFWRYLFETAAWYALGWWLGGWGGALIFLIMGVSVVFQMRLSDYIQHYGLRRVRLPSSRFERVQPHHVWSADYRFTNWLYYNAQRHPDHHAAANRRYPVLQHHGEDTAPQLPGTYGAMMSLAAFPRRWFETMNPLVDRYRARFYPQIEDWSAYDSEAFAARPEAFDAIAEILAAAPRLARWMNRAPKLLDCLKAKEFNDLDLPKGFGPDSEFERIARRGLARVYWTHDLGTDELKEQISQISVHGRPGDCGSDAGVVQRQGLPDRRAHDPRQLDTGRGRRRRLTGGRCRHFRRPGGGLRRCRGAGELHNPEARSARLHWAISTLRRGILGSELDLLFLYEGESARYRARLWRGFRKALRIFSRENLLIAPFPVRAAAERSIQSFADFVAHHREGGSADELLELAGARSVCRFGRLGSRGTVRVGPSGYPDTQPVA